MIWANPLVLGVGGCLLALPVVLHFLMQPKPKKVMLPTLRFLQERQQSTRSRMRLRHFLLLVLRCLAIALVTLALAGPSVASREFGNWLTVAGIFASALIVACVLLAAWLSPTGRRNGLLLATLAGILASILAFGAWSAARLLQSDDGQLLGDAETPVAAVVLIDTAPHMQFQFNNLTRLQRAQETATWLVRQFPDLSRISIVATDNDQPFFSVDQAAAERRIEKLQIAYVPSPIPVAFNQALQLLDGAEQERKEIYVVTDLAASAWSGQSAKTLKNRLERMPDLNVMLIDVGEQDVSNFSLLPVQLSATEITESGGITVRSSVQRRGSADQRTVRLKIEQPDPARPVMRDGRAVYSDEFWEQSVPVDVRADGQAPVEFRFRQDLKPGVYHGTVELDGQDSLDVDNRRYFTIRVSPRWRTLVVSPPDVSPVNLISTIAPTRAVETGTAMFDCLPVDMAEFEQMDDLSGFDSVFLLDPTPISDGAWQRLSQYARAGGGVVIFAGHNAADGHQASESFRSEEAVRAMGVRLTTQWRRPDRDLFARVNDNDLAHPLFDSFRALHDGLQWNRFPVMMHWGVELPSEDRSAAEGESPTAAANILLRFSNRQPALVEQILGEGRILTMTTPITEPAWHPERPIWNELFLGKPLPAWLLTRAIAQYSVSNDSQSLNIAVGDTARLNNDPAVWPERWRIFTPDPTKPSTVVNAIDGTLRYRFTDVPGHYRMKGQLAREQSVLRGFSANLDPAATDPARTTVDQLEPFFGADRFQLVTEKEDIKRQQGANRRGKEFYPLLMLVLLMVVSVEQLVSNRFYSVRGSSPRA